MKARLSEQISMTMAWAYSHRYGIQAIKIRFVERIVFFDELNRSSSKN